MLAGAAAGCASTAVARGAGALFDLPWARSLPCSVLHPDSSWAARPVGQQRERSARLVANVVANVWGLLLLGVATGLGAWMVLRRADMAGTLSEAKLISEIKAILDDSRCTYGAPRVHAELLRRGKRVGRKRVALLMRKAGWLATARADFG
jgi:hypothetical protein